MKKILVYLLLTILVFACAPEVKREVTAKPIPLPREEQEKKALEAFNKILELTETGSREEILPRLEHAYIDIIKHYPEAPLAQESYWRLNIKEYIKTGELTTPVYLFYYSEVKYGLGDYKEAEKGFRTIITLFPGSSEASVAKKA